MINKYRKKPVEIEAMIWDENNELELLEFCGCKYHFNSNHELFIETLEGGMKASVGDYIIKGIKGEFYPCKPDVFEITYERIN